MIRVVPEIQTVIREVTPSLVAEFVEFSLVEYKSGGPTDASVVEWRHLTNSSGPSTAVMLKNGPQIIGRIWIQFNHWSVLGQELRTASPIDFLIRPDARRIQNFLELFKSGIRVSCDNADLVLHTSNPLTNDLYQKLLKLIPVTELDGAILPLRPFSLFPRPKKFGLSPLMSMGDIVYSTSLRILCKVVTSSNIRFVDTPTLIEQTDLISKLHLLEICGRRSPLDRSWRFAGTGEFKYFVQWIANKNGILGYVVWSDRLINEVEGRFIVDVVLPGQHSWWTILNIWLKVASRALKDGSQALFFFYNKLNPSLKKLASFPFIRVKRERLPQRIPIFIRVPDSKKWKIQSDIDWSIGYFVLSDFDMF